MGLLFLFYLCMKGDKTMGMYTELNIGIALEKDTPKEVIDTLRYMLGDIEELEEAPDHPLFRDTRWAVMLGCGSYYFDRQPDSKLYVDELFKKEPMYFLNVGCNLKNYDSEIELFLDWIIKYSKTYGFVGYMRYEEFDDPTLIYFEDGKVEYKSVREGCL